MRVYTYTQMDKRVGKGCVWKKRFSGRERGMRQGKRGENNPNLLCVCVKLSKNKQKTNLHSFLSQHSVSGLLGYLVL